MDYADYVNQQSYERSLHKCSLARLNLCPDCSDDPRDPHTWSEWELEAAIEDWKGIR